LFIILASEKKTHWEWYCNCHFSRARLWTFHSKNDALPFPACVHYCACGKRAHRWDEILVCFVVPFFYHFSILLCSYVHMIITYMKC